MLAGERLKVRKHDRVEVRSCGQGGFHLALGVKQQVDVRRGPRDWFQKKRKGLPLLFSRPIYVHRKGAGA